MEIGPPPESSPLFASLANRVPVPFVPPHPRSADASLEFGNFAVYVSKQVSLVELRQIVHQHPFPFSICTLGEISRGCEWGPVPWNRYLLWGLSRQENT